MIQDQKIYFKMYLECVAEQRVVVREIEKDPTTNLPYPVGKWRGKAHYMPYRTRFNSNYAMDLHKKLIKIKFKYGTLLTLTVDPKRFSNIDEAIESLKRAGIWFIGR